MKTIIAALCFVPIGHPPFVLLKKPPPEELFLKVAARPSLLVPPEGRFCTSGPIQSVFVLISIMQFTALKVNIFSLF